MQTDTSPEIDRLQIERLRSATPAERLQAALDMSRLVISLSRQAIARLHPEWTEDQVLREWVTIHYGKDVARLLPDDYGRPVHG